MKRSIVSYLCMVCAVTFWGPMLILNAAELKLATVFSDHMVLQREKTVPVWGWGDPGEQITVEFAGQKRVAKADEAGKWMVRLKSMKASPEPQTMLIRGATEVRQLKIEDVLVGEVWLGSGQSNMAWPVSNSANFESEKPASTLPLIRMFREDSAAARTAAPDASGKWLVCTPDTVGGFSATLFFFGRELHSVLKVPVGLINSSVGGTPIEAWIAEEVQVSNPELKVAIVKKEKEEIAKEPMLKANYQKALAKWTDDARKAKEEGRPEPRKPVDPMVRRARKGSAGGLFNGKIAPLIPYAIRGIVWYQGESNALNGDGSLYKLQLPLLVSDWRKRWDDELPFAWVQLPNFQRDGDGWMLVQEAMLKTLGMPRTGMAITIDIGEATNIHPRNKQDVGRRLALWALGDVYGKEVAATSGPLPAGFNVKASEVTLSFTHGDGGLVAKDGDLKGFVIAGEDRQWKPAQARIDGKKVVVSSPDVPQPAAVRYAWAAWPECNLYNGAGLPASPFRTDAWDTDSAEESKYSGQLASLRDEILGALPVSGPQALAAYLKACEDEKVMVSALDSAREALGRVSSARELVAHAKDTWIAKADKGIAEAEGKLKEATVEADREILQKKMADLQQNRLEGVEALKERQAVLDTLSAEEPVLIKALEAAEAGRAEARANTMKALKALGSGAFLAGDKLEIFLKACEAEKGLEKELADAQAELAKVGKARGLVAHAKDTWIAKADKGIAETEAKLKDGPAEADREALLKALDAFQTSRQEGVEALKERQAALDLVLPEEPGLTKNLEAAKEALKAAKAGALKAFGELGLDPLLENDGLDAKLVKYVVMSEATSEGLAAFAKSGKEQAGLIEQLLSDPELMKQMVMADGASGGQYGAAMQIYSDIRKASPRAGEGALQRLVLAVSLEHAEPIPQRNADSRADAPTTVDPVKRYLSYEKAFLDGELDPAFKDFDVWEYRMIVYGEEPDEISAWGRQMLRNYRPDHISNPDYAWRYLAAVRTDIPYCFGYEEHDRPELQFFQNILMNGGVCGRRAFFGRFMLRAFGIPSTARPQPGHAALVHWTPDGWVIALGAGWGSGWTKTRYKEDVDFLANVQAREDEQAFMQVKRAQWLGDVFGEERVFGLKSGNPGFWYGASLTLQRRIIEDVQAKAHAAVGEELGEANESAVKYDDVAADVTDEDRKIVVDQSGVITIPAVACSEPTKSTGRILFMPSNLGGKQMHYNRVGKPEVFAYRFDAPRAGKYKLTARVVTPTNDQVLLLSLNGAAEPVSIALPFTVGMWENSEPVEIELVQGQNTLTFSRGGEKISGLTIREFTLIPVK